MLESRAKSAFQSSILPFPPVNHPARLVPRRADSAGARELSNGSQTLGASRESFRGCSSSSSASVCACIRARMRRGCDRVESAKEALLPAGTKASSYFCFRSGICLARERNTEEKSERKREREREREGGRGRAMRAFYADSVHQHFARGKRGRENESLECPRTADCDTPIRGLP